jgi:O-antigen/teichoic acid export membrane protein
LFLLRVDAPVTARLRFDPAARTALSLASSTALTALVGIAYWAIAARFYGARTVGTDSALIATIMAISTLCQLNLNNAVTRFLPQVRRGVGRRVMQAYGVAVVLSAVAGVALVALAPRISARLSFVADSIPLSAAVILSLVVWSIFVLQDDVLTALGKAPWIPLENLLFSCCKLLVLCALSHTALRVHGVFLSWFVPTLIFVPAINYLIARRAIPEHVAAVAGSGLAVGRRLLAFLAKDLVGSTALQVAAAVTPLLVVGIVGAAKNAYFYIPFTLVTTSDLLFWAITASLTTEAARCPARVADLTRRTMRRLIIFQTLVIGVQLACAPLILAVFGHGYAHDGVTVMRWLAAASAFRTIQFLFATATRLQGEGWKLLVSQVANAALLICCIRLLGSRFGVSGVGAGWFLASALLGLITLGYVISFARRPAVATFN